MRRYFCTAETGRRGVQTSKYLLRTVNLTLRLGVSAVIILVTAMASLGQIAVRGNTVWTMAGDPISNGVVLIKDGKIEAVGPESSITIPAGYRVIKAQFVTPGLIDAHTVVGLNGYLNQPHDQMALDSGASIQPELRAIDAYNAQEKLVEWVRQFGVTTIHTGHQPGALVSGQTMIAKTAGSNVDQATIVPTAMVAVTIGDGGNAGAGRSPGTRAKQAAMLRAELIKAQENSKKAEPAKDLKSEIMMRIIKREIPLLITAHRAQDILTALRIAKEFNIKIVLDGVADAHIVLDDIKSSGFPVIVHPTMARAGDETENLSIENASKLRAAGIRTAMQRGFEGYVPKTRVVLFEAAMAASTRRLLPQEAMAMITIEAARILGIDNRVGSLEKGKDADVAMYDGDPFEFTSHCTGTIINGQVVSEVVR